MDAAHFLDTGRDLKRIPNLNCSCIALETDYEQELARHAHIRIELWESRNQRSGRIVHTLSFFSFWQNFVAQNSFAEEGSRASNIELELKFIEIQIHIETAIVSSIELLWFYFYFSLLLSSTLKFHCILLS
ncbi:MAG: hypothetical protein ACRCW3_04045, partial [Metamycoplasmataceae bacterium]